MTASFPDPASFRDEAGRVYHVGDRVLRAIYPAGADDYVHTRDSGLLEILVDRGLLVGTTEIVTQEAAELSAKYLLEHPRLPFISYPYEWSFSALQAAALLSLDLQCTALVHNATLVDASAYNVQFDGSKPLFIDPLSLRRYREGEYWYAQNQFCENFLNPLLLRAALGISYNDWFRGSLEGIESVALSQLLPFRWRVRPTVFSHVVLPSLLQRYVTSRDSARDDAFIAGGKLPKSTLTALLRSVRSFIAGLTPKKRPTVWKTYAMANSYSAAAQAHKLQIVSDFAARLRPKMVWDMGCNTGVFSLAMLASGAERVVGFDSDPDVVDVAFLRASTDCAKFLPLVLDAANPSPSHGWNQQERVGLDKRAAPQALIALALVHHLVIKDNIPLPAVLDWLIALSPTGLIELVPKGDPMVIRMLAHRQGKTFADYDQDLFERHLQSRAHIVARHPVADSGRVVYHYDRRTGS